MKRNEVYFSLSVLLLGVLLISGTCSVLTKALPNTDSSTNTQPRNNSSLPIASMKNSTLATNINDKLASANILSAIGASSIRQYSTNATYSPPSATINVSHPPPMFTPPNSNLINHGVQPMYTKHWYLMDIWSTRQGQNMPSYMSGTFKAVDNTIGGMQASNDWVLYLPMNVAYGTSSSNFDWFQFGIEFGIDGFAAFSLCEYYDAIPGQQQNLPIEMPYTSGDTYTYDFSPSGSNTVTFNIEDDGPHNYNPWTSGPLTVPSTQMLHYPSDGFSPCSVVEGYTESSLTNIPYVQTTIGYGMTTHYHDNITDSPLPPGISTGVWSAGSNYYYWSMCGDNNIASITGYNPIGYGSVTYQTNLIGARNGNYAHIYGGNYGDGGYIKAQMNALSGGNIYVYGYSVTGYYSMLYLYVSNDDYNWVQIGGTPVSINPGSAKWISLGQPYMDDFQYICITGYDSGGSVNLHLDAITVGTDDPDLTVLVFDESSGSYVSGIPILVDGNVVSSGDTVSVTPLDHLFQAPDSDGGGAFSCFFDGSSYYANSADITIAQDTIITAYYNYLPTYSLTINCYDCYFHETTDSNIYVDGNYVGTGSATVQVPIGAHTVTLDYQAYNEGWNDYGTIMEIDGNYCGNYQILVVDTLFTLTYLSIMIQKLTQYTR